MSRGISRIFGRPAETIGVERFTKFSPREGTEAGSTSRRSALRNKRRHECETCHRALVLYPCLRLFSSVGRKSGQRSRRTTEPLEFDVASAASVVKVLANKVDVLTGSSKFD